MQKFFNANNEILITISEVLTISKFETGTKSNPHYGLNFEFLNGESQNVHYGSDEQAQLKDYNTLANLILE